MEDSENVIDEERRESTLQNVANVTKLVSNATVSVVTKGLVQIKNYL